MKNIPVWAWILIGLLIVVVIVVLVIAFKKPATQTIISPQPTGQPNLINQAAGILGNLPLGDWLSNLFGGKNNNLVGNTNCNVGVPSATNPCIDECGFLISSDINPVCV